MRSLRLFEEFVEDRVVRKKTSDINRAKSLAEEAKKRNKFILELVSKIGIKDSNANYFIENAYDALIELLRAKLLVDGYYSSGEGAHEAEVSYMRDLGFAEREVRFMNDLRYYRNGILYYGKDFDTEYAEKVVEFLRKAYPKMMKILGK
ncbi:hypothetical protein ACFL0V_02400 [Nanoarchaeota archaeon]